MKSASRRAVSPRVRRAIRSRSGGRCEDCGRPLQAFRRKEYPEQWTDREVFGIFHDYPCHRCGFQFPVIDGGILEDSDLGRRIQERFPAFYRDYSRTLRHSYWANHCPSCGALQGDYYITEYGVDREPDDSLIIDPWRPGKVEERHVVLETVEWGNLHHLDGNPSNNDLSNLRLLCVRCHAARHTEGRGSQAERGCPEETRETGPASPLPLLPSRTSSGREKNRGSAATGNPTVNKKAAQEEKRRRRRAEGRKRWYRSLRRI